MLPVVALKVKSDNQWKLNTNKRMFVKYFPNIYKYTLDLYFWPIDLNIHRDLLPTKDLVTIYLPGLKCLGQNALDLSIVHG